MENLPTQTLSGFSALSEQQQREHRVKIGVRVRAILAGFWQHADTPDVQQAMEVEGWIDVLEQCSHSEIRFAWRDYQTDLKNRTERGRLVKPDAGALFRIILSKRAVKPKPQQPTPESHQITEEKASPERKQQILDEAGFDPYRGFGTVKSFPKPPVTPKSHLKENPDA